MNPQREDPRMLGRKHPTTDYDPTAHEVFHGPDGTERTSLARTFMEEGDIARHDIEAWVIDPFLTVAECKNKVDRYTRTPEDINELLATLLAETFSRAEHMANLALTKFVPGDDRHALPLISVTITDADEVLRAPRRCHTVGQVIRMSRRAGIRFRLVVPSLAISSFGGSELIRSTMTNASVFACEKASV